MDNSDNRLYSSSQMVDSFVENVVWRDMMTLIREQIEQAEIELQQPETTASIEQVRMLQAEILARRDFLLLPTVLKEALQTQADNGKRTDPDSDE